MLSFETILDSYLRQVTEQWRDVLTDFMPIEQIMNNRTTIEYSGANFRVDGGYEDAARVRLLLTMQEGELTRDEMDIHIVRFTGNTKFIEFSHRDCLGALMGLGIERKCLGDILVRDNGFDVMTNREIIDYLTMSRLTIKHVPMRAEEIAIDGWEAPAPKFDVKRVQVMQTRCDALLAKVFNLSRTQAVNLIKAGLVQIDHATNLNASKQCEEGMVIAARGYGKFRVGAIEGLSKKGKINIIIEKYI